MGARVWSKIVGARKSERVCGSESVGVRVCAQECVNESLQATMWEQKCGVKVWNRKCRNESVGTRVCERECGSDNVGAESMGARV